MSGLAHLFKFQEFLARQSLPHEFTVELRPKAWDSLLKEAAQPRGDGWLSREQVEALGASGVMRIAGPHGYFHVRRGTVDGGEPGVQ